MAEKDWKTELVSKSEEVLFAVVTLVGVAIVILSALRVFRYKDVSLAVPDLSTRIALAVFGLFVAASGLFLFDRKQKAGSAIPNAENYGIRIAYPSPNAKIASVNVQGSLKKRVPDGYKLWIFRIYGDGKFYPLKECMVNESGDAWEADDCDIGGKTGDKRSLSVYIVGRDGLALISYIRDARQVFKPIRDRLVAVTRDNDISFMPPAQLPTRDMIRCASVKVERL